MLMHSTLGRGHRWQRILIEVGIFAAGVLAYFIARGMTESDRATALAHSWRLIDVERRLGMFREADLQDLITGSDTLSMLGNWIYIYGHWPVIIISALWLLWRHPTQYRWLRNAMLVSGLIGVIVFVSYPVAPPRLLPIGIVDTVTLYSDAYRVLQPPALVNQYAALPSLHAGWNLLVGIALLRATGTLIIRIGAVAMPVMMAFAVVITGNHFVIDVALGVIIGLGGAAIASWDVLNRAERDPDAGRAGRPGTAGFSQISGHDTTRSPIAF